jgi:hypothetical protein
MHKRTDESKACHCLANAFVVHSFPRSIILIKYKFLFQKLVATRVWEIKLTHGSQRITAVVSKSSIEKVHSPGRVLGDRSVLYKYINPNLVAVLTQGFDPVHKRKWLCGLS